MIYSMIFCVLISAYNLYMTLHMYILISQSGDASALWPPY